MKIKIISTPNQKAFGGNLQTQGATWNNGFSYVGNGGSHESNPNEGIQVGIDPQGIPNLVEEGEVIWKDFVFSNRLTLPKKELEAFKLKGNKPLTYADAAFKLSEEIKERPNDPISKAGRDRMLSHLADSQEVLKQKKEQQAIKQKFNQMSPEEQAAAIQLSQQALAQQNMEPQQMQDPTAAMGMMSAYGGPINRFDKGGKSRIAQRKNNAGKYTLDWFRERAKALGYTLPEDFNWQQYDKTGNLERFNNWYAEQQQNKAKTKYIEAQRKKWENDELKSLRYKKSDNGDAIYKAKYYDDTYKDKNYIGKDNSRITTDEYNQQKKEYYELKQKKNTTEEEKAKIKAFEDAAYVKRDLSPGSFLRDYEGNIIYDTSNNLKDTWTAGQNFEENWDWDPKNAAKIYYNPDSGYSFLSNLRYAPALGGAIGLINDFASKPDYSRAWEIKNAGAYTAPTITYKPLGNYLRYNPLDINYGMNRLGQEAAATRRAVLNTAGTRGAAMSGLLSADYNAQQQYGDLYRKALEYNDALQQKVEDFNRTTNTFNSQQDLQVQRANQNAIQTALKDKYQGIVAGNTLMDSIDARREASRSANLTNLVNSLGQIGEQEWDKSRINSLIDRGVLLDYRNNNAYGGMLTKRKKKGGRK